MWPAFLDDLMPTSRPYGVSGISSSNGFRVSVTIRRSRHRWDAEYHADTAHADEIDMPVCLLLTGLMLICFGVGMMCLGAFWYLHLILQVLARNRRIKEWHWYEHQVVAIMNDDDIPTPGLLRSQSPVQVRCGSVRVTTFLIAAIGTLSTMISIGDPISLLTGLISLSAICACRAHWKIDLPSIDTRLQMILLTIGTPALALALVFERVLYLRKPDPLHHDRVARFGATLSMEITELLLATT